MSRSVSRNARCVTEAVSLSGKMNFRLAERICLSFFFALLLQLQASPKELQPITQKNVPAKMRDGVVLRADVILPSSGGKFPVLVYRTPYGKENAPREWATFGKAVARGYAVVIQDVRGRYSSDGEFDPYKNEGRDGYDTIEWAATQSWSNGDVGTFGLSYPGAVQWLAAIESPPHLKAMVPAMTFSTPQNFFYSGGAFDGSWIDWIWFNIAPDIRAKKNLPGPKTYKEAAAAWKAEHERLQPFQPLRDLPDFKDVAPFYYEWLAHPPADPWWDWAELRGKYDRVHCAVLNISGWYDEAYGPDGATTNFNGLLAARKGEKDARTQTIIGAWTHGELERTRACDMDFSSAAKVDYDEIILRWVDHYVKVIDQRCDREKPVHIFVMSDNNWRDEDAWPVARATATSFYLYMARKNSPHQIWALQTDPPTDLATYFRFISNPSQPLTDPYEEFGARDYQSLPGPGHRNVLVFDSPALKRDTEVTGPMRATIFASANAPDFDLWVRVLDVWPDGRSFNLMSPGLDVLRASYRNGSLQSELLEPNKVYELKLDRLLTSNVFKKGHKLRVPISGAFAPHFFRNLQTLESGIKSSKMQAALIRIYMDKEHPSAITLPVIPH